MRKTPLRRKTALRCSSVIRKATPKARAAQARQKSALSQRSGNWCELRLILGSKGLLEPKNGARCNAPATDAAHIIPRRFCGKARDLADVVVHACRACHIALDDPLLGDGRIVFVPDELFARCLAAIAAHSKIPLEPKWQQR